MTNSNRSGAGRKLYRLLMALEESKFNTVVSLAIIVAWVVTIFLIAGLSSNAPVDSFTVMLLYLYTMLFALGMGLGLLMIRCFNVPAARLGFIYNFFGWTNLLAGMAGLFSLLFKHGNASWLLFLVCFVVGIIICVDILYKTRR